MGYEAAAYYIFATATSIVDQKVNSSILPSRFVSQCLHAQAPRTPPQAEPEERGSGWCLLFTEGETVLAQALTVPVHFRTLVMYGEAPAGVLSLFDFTPDRGIAPRAGMSDRPGSCQFLL